MSQWPSKEAPDQTQEQRSAWSGPRI